MIGEPPVEITNVSSNQIFDRFSRFTKTFGGCIKHGRYFNSSIPKMASGHKEKGILSLRWQQSSS